MTKVVLVLYLLRTQKRWGKNPIGYPIRNDLIGDFKLVTIVDVGDQNGQNRHQHFEVITNTLRRQHPAPTSMLPN